MHINLASNIEASRTTIKRNNREESVELATIQSKVTKQSLPDLIS